MSDIMLDIETLGTQPGCIVLSIGAVEFDNALILRTFHAFIDPRDSAEYGLHIDAGTVMWWLGQSKEAQDAIVKMPPNPLIGSLKAFSEAFEWGDKRVWCNGAAFDFPILAGIFKAAGLPIPWKYYNEMDLRTIKGLLGVTKWKAIQVKPALAHSALEDAVAQAKTVQNYYGSQA